MAKKKEKNWSGEVRWIKISTNIFDDEKIKLIEKMPEGDTLLVIWFKLLVRAGLVNNNGLIYLNENIPYTDEMLSIVFDKPLPTIRLALRTFQQFGMIGISDTHTILLSNWEKYQNKDGLEKVRDQGRKRQQKFREKQAQLLLANSQKITPENNSNVTGNVTVTECNATEVEVEEDIEVDNNINNSCSSRSIYTENPTITTPIFVLNDDQKLYGEFGNVCLTNHQYQKLLGICLSQKLLDELIEELSCAIGKGNEESYKADYPEAHFIRLRDFYNWRKTHPKINDKSTQDKMEKWVNN